MSRLTAGRVQIVVLACSITMLHGGCGRFGYDLASERLSGAGGVGGDSPIDDPPFFAGMGAGAGAARGGASAGGGGGASAGGGGRASGGAAGAGPNMAGEGGTMAPAERGLVGQYWDNLDFSGAPTFTRIDTRVELVWSDSPAPGVSNRFSARWQGFLLPPTQGTYQLTLESDDGSRLWLGGELLIDQWQGAPNLTKREVLLDPSQPRELRLELYSLGGSASLRLQWESPSIPLQTVPVENLSVP